MARKTPSENPHEDGPRATPAGNALENDEFLTGLPKDGKARVIGPVRIQSRISKGGMGIVYRGRHVKLDIDVAVKFLLPNLAEENPEYVVRFEREAKIAAQLNNENLVRVFDVDSEKDYHYVVMELVCGETARDRVARKGPLSEAEAVEIVLGATRGLEAAHRKGIVHRDIKPENIMIDATGIVKLADLGIAKMVGSDSGRVGASITQPGFVMGTPSFMPPEQFNDSSGVGFAGDIYSMGATLYFLLTAKPPYPGNIYEIVRTIASQDFPDIRKERSAISNKVAEILRNCTARDPRARYPDATALLGALEMSGTDRRNLKDADTGTVTAVARVSTPPARRVGEIRLELPREGGGDSSSPGGAPRTKTAPVGRRGAPIVVGFCIFALGFALLGLAITWKVVKDAPPGTYAKKSPPPSSSAPVPAAMPLSSAGPAAAPPAPSLETRGSAPARAEGPASDAAGDLAREKLAVEKSLAARAVLEKPLSEKALAEKALAGKAGAGKPAAEAQGAEKPRAPQQGGAGERMQYNQKLLERAKDLLGSGEAFYARKIFDSVKDWGDLQVEASRVRMKVLLASNPPAEGEASDLLRSLCSDPAASGAGSACEVAYEELFAYTGTVPQGGVGPATWERRVQLLKSIPAPPDRLRRAVEARAAARARLCSGYLSFLASAAASAVRSEDLPAVRGLLERADKFVKDEGVEAELKEQVSLLAAQKRAASELEAEISEWLALAPLYPAAGTPLAKLEDGDLAQRVEKFAAFSRRHPESPRKPSAENYRARFQEELDRRGKK